MMILYLARQYLLLFSGVACPVFLIGVEIGIAPGVSLFHSLAWASLLSAAGTYFDFRRRNLWPLYDNLRIRIEIVLGALVTGTLSSAALLRLCL